MTEALKKNTPKVAVIILTMHTNASYIRQAFAAGALAFVNKESVTDTLNDAIDTVLEGKQYIDSDLIPKITKSLTDPMIADPPPTADESYGSLTKREQTILRYLAEELDLKKIAKKLSISPSTVENHRTSICKKLCLKNRVGLLHYCVRIGIAEPGNW